MRIKQLICWLSVVPLLLVSYSGAWAAFGEDIEKPQPQFTQDNGDWIAKLIPRGKSTPIEIRFHVEGGTLRAVATKEYTDATHPQVDPKNFRSDFFAVLIDPAQPEAEVRLSLSSDYFTNATDLWGPTAPDSLNWGPVGATNTSLAQRVNMLTVMLRDGGRPGADGTSGGPIELVVGPRDSFWGYALGTLFIRFFGIFLVLAVLMIGMMFSGKIFGWIENRKKAGPIPAAGAPTAAVTEPTPSPPPSATGVPPQTVAAIALALHLQRTASPSLAPAEQGPPSNWALAGRGRLHADRLVLFDRISQK